MSGGGGGASLPPPRHNLPVKATCSLWVGVCLVVKRAPNTNPPTSTLTNNMNLHYPGHTARQASKKGEQCVQDEGRRDGKGKRRNQLPDLKFISHGEADVE